MTPEIDKHITALRLRVKLLEQHLIPTAARDRDDLATVYRDELVALQWVLATIARAAQRVAAGGVPS